MGDLVAYSMQLLAICHLTLLFWVVDSLTVSIIVVPASLEGKKNKETFTEGSLYRISLVFCLMYVSLLCPVPVYLAFHCSQDKVQAPECGS